MGLKWAVVARIRSSSEPSRALAQQTKKHHYKIWLLQSAQPECSRTSFLRPLYDAVCPWSERFAFSILGISNLCSTAFSSSLKTGSAQSLPFLPLQRSKFSTQAAKASSIRMEGSDETVQSIVVYVAVPNREAGKKLARSIIEEKLAACVNIVTGIYLRDNWAGMDILMRVLNQYTSGRERFCQTEELLIIKTRQPLLNELTEHVKANHEYDVLEVISLPITGGSIPYLKWLKDSTKD